MNNPGSKPTVSWWEKLIGGIIGRVRGDYRTRDAIFRTLFSTIGQITRADGRITKEEVVATEALMQRLQLTESEKRQAIQSFQKGKEPDFDLHGTLQEFATHFKDHYELRIMFMELLLEAAVSDGKLCVGEDTILERARTVLKIPINVYIAMLSACEAEPEPEPEPDSGNNRQAVNKPQSLSQAYAALGLKGETSAQEVKRAYRRLVSQYHPDKLSSQGLPDEIMKMARRRMREINAAYDRIKSSREIK